MSYVSLHTHSQYSILDSSASVKDLAKRAKERHKTLVIIFGTFLLLWFFPGVHRVVHMGILFLMGFFVFGPQMLIGMAAAELSHKKAAGTATGFCGWFAYFGAAAACVPIGMIIDSYSWTGYLSVIGVCSISALLLLLPLWSATGKKPVVVEA